LNIFAINGSFDRMEDLYEIFGMTVCDCDLKYKWWNAMADSAMN
jgi:hypothetical protein